MSTKTAIFSSLVVPSLIASVLGCRPEVPAAPTYAKEVQPILAAHCARCHSEDLSLGVDPNTGKTPLVCHLNRYEDAGDCSTAATCSYGAGSPSCAALIVAYTSGLPEEDARRMPPKPSDPLNDWEKEVLNRWAAVMPPAR